MPYSYDRQLLVFYMLYHIDTLLNQSAALGHVLSGPVLSWWANLGVITTTELLGGHGFKSHIQHE